MIFLLKDDEKHELFKTKRIDLSHGTNNVGISGLIFFLEAEGKNVSRTTLMEKTESLVCNIFIL